MNLEELTLKEIRELCQLAVGLGVADAPIADKPIVGDHPYVVGENYFVRTVTMYYTGKLIAVFEGELVLVDAAWIADTGRFHVALAKGESALVEVEPYPDGVEVPIPRGSITDACRWLHALPRTAK